MFFMNFVITVVIGFRVCASDSCMLLFDLFVWLVEIVNFGFLTAIVSLLILVVRLTCLLLIIFGLAIRVISVFWSYGLIFRLLTSISSPFEMLFDFIVGQPCFEIIEAVLEVYSE